MTGSDEISKSASELAKMAGDTVVFQGGPGVAGAVAGGVAGGGVGAAAGVVLGPPGAAVGFLIGFVSGTLGGGAGGLWAGRKIRKLTSGDQGDVP